MRTKLAIIGAAVCLARAAFAVTMASQPWTTNRIAEAEARVAVKITAATNAIPAPDFSQNNAQLRETIVAVSPPADLTDATNHTRAALSAFAGTGTVERARSYGTPTRWTDASGDVWEVVSVGSTNATTWSYQTTPQFDVFDIGANLVWVDFEGYFVGWSTYNGMTIDGGEMAERIEYSVAYWDESAGTVENGTVVATRTLQIVTNLVGRVAMTTDIAQIAEDVVREKSLGGIYDTELEVWWTPKMRNGALRYETNAVQNAADTLAVVSNIVASGGLASVDAVDAKISTNNAAFVSAVLAVPLAGADVGDLAEIAEYGGYGTVGAALLALIAGLAALKRRVTSAETALAGKMPMYPMVAVTPSSGTLTVTPYTVATYTADTSAETFSVSVGTGTAGTARDCELVIDCAATGAVAPTVTWPSNFHPRTDAATDFACEAGVRNVYFISEFSSGEFAVGGWQETAGGNA